MNSLKFIDLFSGIGGIRLGFENAAKEVGLRTECVFASENDKYARAVYEKYFMDRNIYGDIQKLKNKDINKTIPDHNVLLAGFPCQPFSHAGKKGGFEDARGALFFDIQRILQVKKPESFILENVQHLIGHNKGKTLEKILNILTKKLGYYIPKPELLNAKDFGLPQYRNRVFIVGFRKFTLFSYPLASKTKTCVGDILEKNIPDIDKYIISRKLWNGHKRRKIEHRKKGRGFGYGKFSDKDPYTHTLSSRYYKDGSEILIDRGKKNPRKLTAKECAGLMGFPPKFPTDIVSVSRYYRLFGNSVAVPVIRALALNVISSILQIKKRSHAA